MTSPAAFPAVAGVEVRHRFLVARGLRFHVAEAGPPDGPPVLALHGWPQHWYAWRKLLPQLTAAGHRVVMPDLRGMGWSDAPEHGYEKDELAADALALLDGLDLGRVALLGHDWGGWAGFLLALRHPERVSRYLALNIVPPWAGGRRNPRAALSLWRGWYQVALASPVLGRRIPQSPGLMGWGLRSDNVHPQTFSDADVAAFTDVLLAPERARASQQLYRSFLLRDLPALAREPFADVPLTVPTLLLFGTKDRAISAAMVEGSPRPGDALQIEFVPDSGHFIAEERPDLVARRALDWFARAE